MPWMETMLLLALLAGGWFWLDSFKAREAAIRAVRAACEADGLLFLDDTVALGLLRPARDDAGRLRLRRVYHFEYSDTGNNRRDGQVTLLGSDLVMLHLLHPVHPQPAQRCRLHLVAGSDDEEEAHRR